MIALLTAVAAAGAVVLSLRRPPRPERLAQLTPGTRRLPRRSPLERIGSQLHVAIGARSSPTADRRLGLGVTAATAGLLVGIAPVAIGAAAWALVRRWRRLRRRRAARHPSRAASDLPDLIDLLALTAGAGLTVPASLTVAARWAPESLRPDLVDARASIDAGVAIVDAIGALEGRWGEAARPLGRVLAEHVRHGSPLLPGLERVGVDARARRRRAAETRARRLPVLLLFPLVLCTLPAFGLLTVAPIIAGTLSSLDEGRLEASASTPLPSEELPCTSRPSPSNSSSCRSSIEPPDTSPR